MKKRVKHTANTTKGVLVPRGKFPHHGRVPLFLEKMRDAD